MSTTTDDFPIDGLTSSPAVVPPVIPTPKKAESFPSSDEDDAAAAVTDEPTTLPAAVETTSAKPSPAQKRAQAQSFGSVIVDFGSFLRDSIPNRIAATMIAVGLPVELWLLNRTAEPIFDLGFPAIFLAIGYVVWFWFTLGLILNHCTRRIVDWRQSRSRPASIVATAGIVALATVMALMYSVSWGLYLQTGRFATWEVAHFAITNVRDLWLYLKEVEPVHLIRGLVIVSGVAAAVPFLIRPLASVRNAKTSGVPFYRNRLWVWLSILVMFGVLGVLRDTSSRRRTTRFASMCNALNPVLTVLASITESVLTEPIRPVLNEANLQPLDTRWAPPVAVPRNQPNVIIVAIESLRHDVVHLSHQGREVTPNINRLAAGGLHWRNAYAQSTHSDYADICLVSSLYPLRTRMHHFYSKNDPWPKTLVYDALKPAGYSTAIISSQNEMWGRMEYFLDTPNLDHFYHPQRSTETHLEMRPMRDFGFYHEIEVGNIKVGKFPDSHTADKAIAWMSSQIEADRPFFLSMNLQSSHFPYAMPDDVPRPFQPCELDSDVLFMIYPIERVEKVRNAFYNAAHEADHQVGRLVEALRERGQLQDTILLVIGENGEAFHENNSVGHGREPVEPVIHVTTVMHGPKYFEPGVEDYPLEHVNLMPTVFGRLGWPPHPNFQGIDALSPDRPALAERLLFFHVISPSATADAVQWAGRWKYMWCYQTDTGVLYDLKHDPGEAHDLSEELPELRAALHTIMMQWRQRQLAYYHFPNYYRNYYPPKAPKFWPEMLTALSKYLERE